MTDDARRRQLAEDLDAISTQVPSMPSAYAELRALLHRLPNPTPPDIHGARAGAADSLVVSGFGGPQSQLVGDPIGQASGGSIGVDQLLTFGQGNLIHDPSFEQMSGAATAIGAGVTTVGQWWRAQRVQNSGAAPTTLTWIQIINRGGLIGGAISIFSSSEPELRVTGAAAAANFDVYVWPVFRPNAADYVPGGQIAILPYLIAGIKTRRKTTAALPAGYTVTIRMELYRVTDATVIATSTPIDYASLNDFDDVRLVWASGVDTDVNWIADTYRWRYKLSVVNTGALATTFTIGLGEPVLQWSWVSTMPPYSPYIGSWYPALVSARQIDSGGINVIETSLAGDTVVLGSERFSLKADGSMRWGGGAAVPDAGIKRTGAATLQVDGVGAASFLIVRLQSTAGQQSALAIGVAGDSQDRAVLFGDATLTGLQLGPGGAVARDLRAYRSGAKILTVDDTAGGAVTLNVVGALQQGGVGASLIGHGAGDHADITRSRFLSVTEGVVDGSAMNSVGASPDFTRVMALADAATQGGFWTWMAPDDWVSGVITIQPIWVPSANDAVAHTVRWSLTTQKDPAGTTISAAGTTVTFTGASAVRTANVVVLDTATSTTLTPGGANELFRIGLRRLGADAADTYVGIVNLLGILVTYTANQ